VARLVHEVCQSEPNCLFLLDEPETSLHPGAQLELVRFLLFETKAKRLQVVISSHSPAIVRCLPQEAIKVFDLDPNGVVNATGNVPVDEAFYILGHPQENKIHILVEDSLAKALVEAVLATKPPKFCSRFIVDFRPGGDAAMKMAAPILMLKSKGLFFLFDGDNITKLVKFDMKKISVETSSEEMDRVIKENLGVSVAFQEDSNMAEATKREQRIQFMNFANQSFHCLPFNTADDAIWNLDTAIGFHKLVNEEKPVPDFSKVTMVKKKFDILAKSVTPPSNRVDASGFQMLHSFFIQKFCAAKGPDFQALVTQLEEIANNAPVH